MAYRNNRLIGRYVRLKSAVFQRILKHAKVSEPLENLFIVAAITYKMKQLVCYGGDQRITVPLADVVLV